MIQLALNWLFFSKILKIAKRLNAPTPDPNDLGLQEALPRLCGLCRAGPVFSIRSPVEIFFIQIRYNCWYKLPPPPHSKILFASLALGEGPEWTPQNFDVLFSKLDTKSFFFAAVAKARIQI